MDKELAVEVYPDGPELYYHTLVSQSSLQLRCECVADLLLILVVSVSLAAALVIAFVGFIAVKT